MTKYEFLERLENNLKDVDYQLRHETLRFYEDFIDNSNQDESEVIAGLKSPEQIARDIKENNTQKSSQDYQQQHSHQHYYDQRPPESHWDNNQARNVLLIIALVFIFSIGIGGIGGVFGIFFGIFGGLFGLLVALFTFGAISFFWGVTSLLEINGTMDLGNILIHVGTFLVYISLTFLWLALFIGIIKSLPAIIKVVRDLVGRLLNWLRGLFK